MAANVGQKYVRWGQTIVILSADEMSGGEYQDDLLIGKTPDVDFEVFTNEGSGVMLKEGLPEDQGGYTYDAESGTITMPPQGYKLKIY